MLNIFNATNMYITSDNHFFHGNIIKYCDRNYNWESDEDILRMNEDMLKEFDKLPDTPDTVVWNLGDLAFSRLITTNPDAFSLLKDIVSRMKGKHRTLCYVIGNHDKYVFRMVRKYTHSKSICDFFEKLGFDYVYNRPLLFDENIILSHMWPLTFFTFPRSKEAWLIVRIDKQIVRKESKIKGPVYQFKIIKESINV